MQLLSEPLADGWTSAGTWRSSAAGVHTWIRCSRELVSIRNRRFRLQVGQTNHQAPVTVGHHRLGSSRTSYKSKLSAQLLPELLQVAKTPSWTSGAPGEGTAEHSLIWSHLFLQNLNGPDRQTQVKKPHTCGRKRPQHLPETGASWEVVERRRLILALRKQSQGILGRRFILNKIYKVFENNQNLMVERVDPYLWMFLSFSLFL